MQTKDGAVNRTKRTWRAPHRSRHDRSVKTEVRRRLLARPELLLLLALVLGCTLLSAGLPLGIAGIGVVSGCTLGLQALGVTLLYSRTRILSFAQFGLGAAAAVLFYAWVFYNQWAVLANGVCGCLAPS